MNGGLYQGTSLWVWAVVGVIWIFVAAFMVAVALALLALAALAVVGFLVWWGWLELRDYWRRRPGPPSGMDEAQVRAALYGSHPPWRVRVGPDDLAGRRAGRYA